MMGALDLGLRNRPGSAPAPGAVFRAFAENRRGTKSCGQFWTGVGAVGRSGPVGQASSLTVRAASVPPRSSRRHGSAVELGTRGRDAP